MVDYAFDQIAAMIDHAILHPAATEEHVTRECTAVREYGIATVLVKPCSVMLAARLLKGSQLAIGTTVSFPRGCNVTAVKVREAEQAMNDGATEIDMVSNIGMVLSEQWSYVAKDIGAVLDVVHRRGGILKVIFENCYLADKHKVELCKICAELGVDFAKTSTGFGTAGATDEDVQLMRRLLPGRVKLKAAGGIRTLDHLLRLRALGADRIGTSSTLAILNECRRRVTADT